MNLALDLRLYRGSDSMEGFDRLIASITLDEWLQAMLGYSSVYFNDEGESWDSFPGDEPTWARLTLQDCMAGKAPTPDEIRAALHLVGLASASLLHTHSRPGSGS